MKSLSLKIKIWPNFVIFGKILGETGKLEVEILYFSLGSLNIFPQGPSGVMIKLENKDLAICSNLSQILAQKGPKFGG